MTSINPPNNTICPPGSILANYNSAKWINWAFGYHESLSNASIYCLSGPFQQLPLSRQYTSNPNPEWCPRCDNVVSCIQDHLDSATLSVFSNSQVILGLTPTLLSFIAPSVGEICMLSSNRPILSLLLSLGGPSVFCFRILTYDDPLASLTLVRTMFTWTPMRSKGFKASAIKGIISVFEYVLALGVLANIIHASWTLGLYTISSWQCDFSWLPLAWTSLSIVLHLIASGSWMFSNTMRSIRAAEKRESKGVAATIWQWMINEFTLCGARKRRKFLDYCKRTELRAIIFTNLLAQIGSLLLTIYGTAILSSLLLIGVKDAFVFVVRYLLSALICRLILMFELSGMTAVENENHNSTNLQRV